MPYAALRGDALIFAPRVVKRRCDDDVKAATCPAAT